jgi:hypothetical protein
MGNHSHRKHEKLSQAGFAAPRGSLTATPPRRIARALGAAAGGLLGVAIIPAAVAFADDYDFVADPNSTEQITGIYGYGFDGFDTAPPAVAGSVEGDQTFDFTDTTTGVSGTFAGEETTSTDALGDTNQEVLVTSASGTDAPPVGSVFDTQNFDDGGYTTLYSAIPSTTGGADVFTDTVETSLGDSTSPATFDAADIPVADAVGVPVGDGDDIVPDSDSLVITSINGLPPTFVVDQGDQLFDVDNAGGTPIGTFDSDEATTTDFAGTYTQAVLVTADTPGTTAGTTAGDVPPVGSVFNTITFGDIENVYSDLTSTTGGADVITDTVITPLGDVTLPFTFDAAKAEVSGPIDVPGGDDLTPTSTEVFTGINGLPPEAVGVQAQQVFDYTDGTQSGSVDADVTNTVDAFGDSSETVLITKDLAGADAPPVGSTFETVTWGDSGYENIYADIASTAAGQDVISDNFVTPFGDFTIPLAIDASSGLANDTFLNLLP